MGKRNNLKKNTKIFIGVGVAVAILVLVAVIIVLLVPKEEKFEYEGWIDCMPPLSEQEGDLCRRAKEANYPYIAY